MSLWGTLPRSHRASISTSLIPPTPHPSVMGKIIFFFFLSCYLGILKDDNPVHIQSGHSDKDLSSGWLL